jgi:pimeloyl-ACP methyl ester carboxylesterase
MSEQCLEVELDGVKVKIPYEMKIAKHIVVFSHGFGVKRDSRGMFSEIVSNLPDGLGYILFDYNFIEGDHVYLRDYTEQVQILSSVIELARKHAEQVSIVGHSMGSITVALLAETDFRSVVLLAPPVAHSKNGVSKWEAYVGAEWYGDNLYVPRRDDTITVFPRKFFEQIPTIDTLHTIIVYAKLRPIVVVEAIEEDVLSGVENYQKLGAVENIELIKIHGNHNFDGGDRDGLVDLILNNI